MAHLRLYLFGSPRLEWAGEPVAIPRRKAMALLCYLAVTGDRHSRDKLATLFWPDYDQRRARAALRNALWDLNKISGEAWLEIEPETLSLSPAAGLWLDIVHFRQYFTASQTHGHHAGDLCPVCLNGLAEAASLYRDDFLAGFTLPDAPDFDEWQLFQVESLRRALSTVLERLAQAYRVRGDPATALSYAHRWLALDPLHEPAHHQLMLLYAQSGQPAAALRQYQLCVDTLQTELGLSPTIETTVIYEHIRSGALGQSNLSPAPPLPLSLARVDWGEAPDITNFYGREAEAEQLTRWLVEDGCHLIGVLGMGGIGKTAFVTHLADRLQGHFTYLIWRSLRNGPPLDELLEEWLLFLSGQQIQGIPPETDKRLSRLLEYLRQQRCLLILDNLETILDEKKAGHYRPGYEAYGRLLQRIGEGRHQSCLVLTSREKPAELARFEGDNATVRSMFLPHLAVEAGRALLQDKGLAGPEESWQVLVERYSGNPLALKIVAETIRELFGGDIKGFLAGDTTIFGGIRELLAGQFERLSALEQALMTWLAIEREAIGPEQLQANLLQPPPQGELLEQLRALRRRSLLERGEAGFTLQNVVMEYVTGRLVERVSQEIIAGEVAGHLNRYALLIAQAKEYVRASQARLILHPIVERLRVRYGLDGVEIRLKGLATKLRQTAEVSETSTQTAEVSETSAVSTLQQGYAAGNLLNLLLHLKPEVSGLDFSGLTVRQAYLQGMRLPEVNFSQADLTNTVFSEIFGAVSTVAFSPDGRLLAAGTYDNRVWVWRIVDGQLLLTCEGHTDAARAVCFSPDGQILASSSADHTIRLWEVHTGQCLNVLEGHTHDVWSVCFSSDGQSLTSGSADHTIRLWEVSTGQCFKTLQGHTSAVRSVCFSPDGRLLASGSFDHTIRLWEVSAGQSLRVLYGHTNEVESISFSPDGQKLASGSADQTIRLWHISSGQCFKILKGHTSTVRAAYFSPDGQTVVSGSHDHTIRLWELQQSGRSLSVLQGHANAVDSLSLSPDGQTLASGSWDRTIRLWEVNTGQCLRILQGDTNWVKSVTFSPDGQLIASGGTDQAIRLWAMDADPSFKILWGHRSEVRSVCFSPDGRTLASSSPDQTIRLWEAHTGQLHKILLGHTGGVTSVCFSSDGQRIASGSDDQTIRLWEVHTGQCLKTLRGHTHSVNSVCFNPDGQIIASGSWDQTIRLWNIRTGQLLKILQRHTHSVNSVCFSPDGQIIASGSSDQTIRLWNIRADQSLKTLQGHSGWVYSVCLSPDGLRLASGSWDRTLRLWDVDTGQCLKTLEGHTGQIWSVCFSPDGRTLASGSSDETIRLWEVESGACLKVLRAERPYHRLNITGAIGLSEAQKAALKALGAYED